MFTTGETLRFAGAVWVVLVAAGSVAAQESAPVKGSVLVAPVQGSEALRGEHGERVVGAVRRTLEARGYQVSGSQESLGQAVVACQTPECVEQALDAAGAVFAIVPAIWSQESGGEELTLTLVQRSRRSVNAGGVVVGDLPRATAEWVDELLGRRAVTAAGSAAGAGQVAEGARPHAWKAGPIILIAGGAGALVAIGVAAGVKSDSQQLNAAGVAAWSAIGAAAIAGGVAWWVVGGKRRRPRNDLGGGAAPAIGLRGTRIDLRLQF